MIELFSKTNHGVEFHHSTYNIMKIIATPGYPLTLLWNEIKESFIYYKFKMYLLIIGLLSISNQNEFN